MLSTIHPSAPRSPPTGTPRPTGSASGTRFSYQRIPDFAECPALPSNCPRPFASKHAMAETSISWTHRRKRGKVERSRQRRGISGRTLRLSPAGPSPMLLVRSHSSSARSRARTQFCPHPVNSMSKNQRYAIGSQAAIDLPDEILVLTAVSEENTIGRIPRLKAEHSMGEERRDRHQVRRRIESVRLPGGRPPGPMVSHSLAIVRPTATAAVLTQIQIYRPEVAEPGSIE